MTCVLMPLVEVSVSVMVLPKAMTTPTAWMMARARVSQRGDGGDLLFALFTLFCEALERGDADAEQLHDNGRVDIRPDAEREQRAVCQRAARDAVHQGQEVVACDRLRKDIGCEAGNRNIASETIDEQQEKRDDELLPDLFDFKSVF